MCFLFWPRVLVPLYVPIKQIWHFKGLLLALDSDLMEEKLFVGNLAEGNPKNYQICWMISYIPCLVSQKIALKTLYPVSLRPRLLSSQLSSCKRWGERGTILPSSAI